jgi:hypothetical protein
MRKKAEKKNLPGMKTSIKNKTEIPPYPLYLSNDVILSQKEIEANLARDDMYDIQTSHKKRIIKDQSAGNNNEDDQRDEDENIQLNDENDSDESNEVMNEKDFEDDMSGSDLDIPGSDLDDQQESIGSEDEENNYYSLGGDDHNDLDEDKG